MVQRWWWWIQSSHHHIFNMPPFTGGGQRGDSCQNSPHCHPAEKSCQRTPIPSYNHFSLLFTPTLYFISAIWCIRMKGLLGNACSRWLWGDRCSGKLSKTWRAKKAWLSGDSWTVSPHWIYRCLSPRIAAIQTFTDIQQIFQQLAWKLGIGIVSGRVCIPGHLVYLYLYIYLYGPACIPGGQTDHK